MSEPTYRALCNSGADCLSKVCTYLPGTVLQWCRLFKRCWNLPAGHCVTGVQAVEAMSEPTCRAPCYSGADCLSGVRTFPPGTVLQWCRLFKQCRNLPTRHCVTWVQTVKVVLKPTYQALCYSGADCLSGVRKQCPSQRAGHCVTVVQTV